MKDKKTRSHLESLSTAELINFADANGLYIPPDLDRVFIIGELLESFTETENKKKPKEEIVIDHSPAETAELPKHYGFSYVDFLIRDPLWVFVFWEIKDYDRENYEKSPDFKGYYLRLIPQNNKNSFTVPVDVTDTSRYIGLHSSPLNEKYIIKLEAVCKETVNLIAESKSFCLPRLMTTYDLHAMKENPLLRLSGITEMPAIGAKV